MPASSWRSTGRRRSKGTGCSPSDASSCPARSSSPSPPPDPASSAHAAQGQFASVLDSLSERQAQTVADELELITPGLRKQRGDDTRTRRRDRERSRRATPLIVGWAHRIQLVTCRWCSAPLTDDLAETPGGRCQSNGGGQTVDESLASGMVGSNSSTGLPDGSSRRICFAADSGDDVIAELGPCLSQRFDRPGEVSHPRS